MTSVPNLQSRRAFGGIARQALLVVAVVGLAGLLASACGRSKPGAHPCADGTCPCIFQHDCPDGMNCINNVCVGPQRDAAVDGEVPLKGFGELCDANDECQSGFCLPDLAGSFCTIECGGGCPDGWACRLVQDPRGRDDPIGLCVVDRQVLCQDCLIDADCNLSGGDRCLDVDGGGRTYCGRDCTFEDCPTGYTCNTVTLPGGISADQCLPDSGTCSCTDATAGQVRGCVNSNPNGTCTGQEICTPPGGWSACSAPAPAPESCNGDDDDCNGRIDDGLDPRPCQVSAGGWTCTGTETCQGIQGYVCDAPTPEAESCDGIDNNCDGQVDEDFVDVNGIYHTRPHCGGCGIDCDNVISNATTTTCEVFQGAARCVATACDPGYFPYLDGTVCLQLPDNLCQSCLTDADCVSPGGLCIDTGLERYCGRDCSASSPYGTTCPTGYGCRAFGGGMQCQPTSNSCLCTSQNAGAIRACNEGLCSGYQTCAAVGGGWDWSACDISWNVEICDGIDNDCNGQIDEGFLNQTTGRYDTDAHCGFCYNDCAAYWVPEIHHATGSCNAGAGFPVCEMGPCLTETDNGVLYEWVDVNGDDADGCECRRVSGNLTTDLPDRGAFPQPGAPYLDENCDGVDGVVTDALFVWAGNPSAGTGTRTDPYRTIGQALAALPASGKAYILVAEGTYAENVVLFEGAQLFGGYASDFLDREILTYATVIQGVRPAGANDPAAVNANGVGHTASDTIVSGFHILGTTPAGGTPNDSNGASTYAVYLRDSGPGLILQNNVIHGGRAAPGGRGSTGAAGFGRQDSPALDGAGGVDSIRVFGPCPAGLLRNGGAGGVNTACTPANGAAGGNGVCPTFDWNASPIQGGQQQFAPPVTLNGRGGHDWSFDDLSGGNCGHVTESGWPTNIQTNNGGDGLDGGDGNSGSRGAGCAVRYGTIRGGIWLPRGGVRGGSGTPGGGGGGGGAGGGTAHHNVNPGDCQRHEQGATGGGGAAGGCGGQGGSGGGAGGASLAIFLYFSTPATAAQAPVISDNRIRRGQAGDGGQGGFGGDGGQGGNGGFGGFATTWSSSVGGVGGDGGNGGPGGGGGGGCGGVSYSVLGFNLSGASYATANEFEYDDTLDTAGSGGLGGGSAAQTGAGTPGAPGAFGNVLYLLPCGAGGACPAPRICDPNNVCVPN